jgi:FHS family L-fucose permease-like MFS transporter
MSIMFPTIFALSTKNLGDQMKLGSGLVIMAIVGGAVLPPLTGLASQAAIENALLIPVFSFGVILYYGLSGYKIKPIPA